MVGVFDSAGGSVDTEKFMGVVVLWGRKEKV
jgi:hypothetical protein